MIIEGSTYIFGSSKVKTIFRVSWSCRCHRSVWCIDSVRGSPCQVRNCLPLYPRDCTLRDREYPTPIPSPSLGSRHFLSHEEQHLQVALVHPPEELAELGEQPGILACATPEGSGAHLALWQIGKLGWLFAVVEELVDRALQGTGKLLQRFDGGHGVTVFDAGDVAAQQTGALLDVALRKLLVFAQDPQAVADNHGFSFLRSLQCDHEHTMPG